ncbi:MAG: zinc ribbon domain-containing protein [Oscillospiraceae bacterium]|nr:zinc ribbon domain-containing protein [Oscillospiraceae bacterium]
MKKCLFCGTENPDSAPRCSACGISFEYYEETEGFDQEQQTLFANRETQKPSRNHKNEAVTRLIGGMFAWALLLMIFGRLMAKELLDGSIWMQLLFACPGLIALSIIVDLNYCDTKQQQETRSNIAFAICFLGSIVAAALFLHLTL